MRRCEPHEELDEHTGECVPKVLGQLEQCSLAAVPGLRSKTTAEFRTALVGVARRLGVSADGLAAVMSLESGFDPAIQNASSRATGLIQILPSEAPKLGTTAEALTRMSAVEQLQYVEKYYRQFRAIGEGVCDLYFLNFAPVCVGKPLDHIAYRGDAARCRSQGGDGRCAYDQNRGMDVDNSGHIECRDICARIEAQLARSRGERIDVVCPTEGGAAARGSGFWLPALAVGAAAAGLVWWLR